jgi:hypothetical protein
MPSISKIPPALNPNDWTKKVGAADKKIGVSNVLKDLNKDHEALQAQELGTDGLENPADVLQRIKEIESRFSTDAKAFEKKAKAAIDAIKKGDAELKGAGPDAVKHAAAVCSALNTVGQEVGKAAAAAIGPLKALLSKLEAQAQKDAAKEAKDAKAAAAKKEEDDEDAAGDQDDGKFRERMKGMLRSRLTNLRKPDSPGMSFSVGTVGKNWAVFIAPKPPGQTGDKICARLIGGTTKPKPAKGRVTYDVKTKTYIFEGSSLQVGGGNARNLQMFIKDLVGLKIKVMLRKPGGESEGAEGDDEADAQLAEADNGADSKKAASAAAEALKQPAATKADAKAAQPVPDVGAVLLKLNSAIQGLQGGLDKFQDEMLAAYKDETDQKAAVDGAKAMLKTARDLCEGLDVKKQLAKLVKTTDAAERKRVAEETRKVLDDYTRKLASDAVVSQLDGNELIPSMRVFRPLVEQIQATRAALN